jgi:hypothetical protein
VAGDPAAAQAATGWRRLLLAAVVTTLLVVSWSPFEPEIPRWVIGGVEAQPDGSVRFVDGAFVTSEDTPDWLADVLAAEYLEVAVRLRPAAADQRGPARILALSAPADDDQRDVLEHALVIGQEGTDLIVRVVRPGSTEQGMPAFEVPGVLTAPDGADAPDWHDLELVLHDELVLRVDGEQRVREEAITGWASAWDGPLVLTLANTPSGERPWEGTIARATVDAGTGEVDLLALDGVALEEHTRQVPPRLVAAHGRVGAVYLAIGVLHTLLGAALGAVLAFARPDRPLRTTLWIVVALAAVANVGKVFVALRHPSVATVLLQVGGGALGALLVVLARERAGSGRGRGRATAA